MRILTRFFYFSLNFLLYWIFYPLPRQRNLWLFGAWLGNRYADSSRYLFEWVAENAPQIRPVWVTRSPAITEALRAEGYEVYLRRQPKAWWLALRAGVAVVTHSAKEDLLPVTASPKTALVQMWHGIPLKKIMYDDTLFSYRQKGFPLILRWKRLLKSTVFPFLDEKYSFISTTSDELRTIFASAFRQAPETVRITGYPRNDVLFQPAAEELPDPPPQGWRTGVYMPTFRGAEGSTVDLFGPFGFDLAGADTALEHLRIRLYLKLHPVNHPTPEMEEEIRSSHNLRFLEAADVYPLLNRFDFLVTDYSSIYFDYLLLDRPIIFAPFDMDTYVGRERDFYFEYDQVTPGARVRSWPELWNELDRLTTAGDSYAARRRQICERFHQFTDGNSSKRVFDEIVRTLA